ncbi:MAG: glycosyltransferase [Microcoleaceae cyanobacterium]
MKKIAYLVNQYPKVSHSFIRREIMGIETCGLEVERFSIRCLESELVDEADQQELRKTRYILAAGTGRLLLNLFWAALTRPLKLLKAAYLAGKIGIDSERGLIYHFIYLVEACTLLWWLVAEQVNQVHVHFGTNSTTVAMLCQELGGPPYSFTVHGPEEFDKAEAIGLTEKINRAAFVVAISSFGKSQLFRWCDYKQWSKIHIVRCGVDDSFLNQTPTPIPTTPRFVCVGRLCEQKGHILLIEAVSQLAAEGLKFKLVFVGDGALRPSIETLIDQLKLNEYIEITGWATNAEVQQHILASQVMVLPSFAEGLPVVLMEALALGRPVITTYVAGIPELVKSGESGWLVPAGSVEDLKNAMKSALQTSPERLKEMGSNGMQAVSQQHNIYQESHHLFDLFKSYLKSE